MPGSTELLGCHAHPGQGHSKISRTSLLQGLVVRLLFLFMVWVWVGVWVCAQVCTYRGIDIEVSVQLSGVGSLLPLQDPGVELQISALGYKHLY